MSNQRPGYQFQTCLIPGASTSVNLPWFTFGLEIKISNMSIPGQSTSIHVACLTTLLVKLDEAWKTFLIPCSGPSSTIKFVFRGMNILIICPSWLIETTKGRKLPKTSKHRTSFKFNLLKTAWYSLKIWSPLKTKEFGKGYDRNKFAKLLSWVFVRKFTKHYMNQRVG